MIWVIFNSKAALLFAKFVHVLFCKSCKYACVILNYIHIMTVRVWKDERCAVFNGSKDIWTLLHDTELWG